MRWRLSKYDFSNEFVHIAKKEIDYPQKINSSHMRVVAVTQARVGSTRLPAKVLKKIGNLTLLELHIQRILKSTKINQLIVATTTNPTDDAIVDLAKKCGVSYYRGSEQDVLDRFYQAVRDQQADYVVRLTSDCPLIDASLIDRIIDHTQNSKLDYCSNTLDPTYPDGQDVEVFTFEALERAWHEAKLTSEREHVTPYLWKNSTAKGGTLFTSENFSEGLNYGHLRMTVDEQNDLDVITQIINQLGNDRSWLEYATYLDASASLKKINEDTRRNEGYSKSISQEKK